jgi:hypothetical protein
MRRWDDHANLKLGIDVSILRLLSGDGTIVARIRIKTTLSARLGLTSTCLSD